MEEQVLLSGGTLGIQRGGRSRRHSLAHGVGSFGTVVTCFNLQITGGLSGTRDRCFGRDARNVYSSQENLYFLSSC